MVNAKWIERKFIILLVDGPTTKKNNWNTYIRYRYKLAKFKKQNPAEYNNLVNKMVALNKEFEDKVFLS
jgi:hypothetical protein